MKNAALLISILGMIMLAGCTTQQQGPNDNQGTENDANDGLGGDQGYVEEKGIITDTLKFQDETTSGEIIKNKLTKTAESRITMRLNDTTEYVDFFGEQVSSAPFMVNFGCKIFAVAFFNSTALAELQEGGNLTIESQEDYPLKGYTVTKAYMEFIDEEDNTKIADCTATGPDWGDIKFNAYRQYNKTFFGMQIGELPETES